MSASHSLPGRIACERAEVPLRRLCALGLEGAGGASDAGIRCGGAAAGDVSSPRLPFAVTEREAKARVLRKQRELVIYNIILHII